MSKAAQGGLPAEDVCCDGSSVVLFLRRSKADQVSKGTYLWLLHVHGSPICPVSIVVEYLQFHPAGTGFFLIHSDGSALSIFQFVSVLQRCLTATGLEAEVILPTPSSSGQPWKLPGGVWTIFFYSVLAGGSQTGSILMSVLMWFNSRTGSGVFCCCSFDMFVICYWCSLFGYVLFCCISFQILLVLFGFWATPLYIGGLGGWMSGLMVVNWASLGLR